jgi:hypothetical protein
MVAASRSSMPRRNAATSNIDVLGIVLIAVRSHLMSE